MLYHLFQYLGFDESAIPGAGLFRFISFRATVAAVLSLLISLFIGKRIILALQRRLIGETIRTTGPESHFSKKGTPTMGGLIILASIILPTLLLARLDSIFVIMLMVATVWMGTIGFIDDYIKVFRKNNEGLKGKFKVVGQIGLGLLIALTLYYKLGPEATITNLPIGAYKFDYASIAPFLGEYAFLVYFPIVIFIVTAVTNAVNLTDGIDGLASGTSAIVGAVLGIFAYMAGNANLADYLKIIHLPYAGETVVYMAAFVGGCIGFLWYNTFPAQVFMGDTGSMALGGGIVGAALITKMELLVPVLCGIFFVESVSVIIQVSWFKYTKRKYGVGRRVFKMTPIHHHYELKGYPEPKIVTRFWIVTVLLAIVATALLRLR